MSTRNLMETTCATCAQTNATTRTLLTEYIKARPALQGSNDVLMSTELAEFDLHMRKLYEGAYARGDWMASEFAPVGDLHLAPGVFADDGRAEQNLWIVFHDSKRRLIGATKLVVDTMKGVLIDETQLDPVLGRGKGVMTNYFRTIVPIFEALQLRFRTEFVLTPESKVLRETLLAEQEMVVTGLRPGAYYSRNTVHARTALVAYGPAKDVRNSLQRAQCSATAVFQPLLDAVCRSALSVPKVPTVVEVDRGYEEVQVRTSDHELATTFAMKGFVPVSFDPFTDAFTFARVPTDLDVYQRLSFLSNESSTVARQLVDYVAGAAAALPQAQAKVEAPQH